MFLICTVNVPPPPQALIICRLVRARSPARPTASVEVRPRAVLEATDTRDMRDNTMIITPSTMSPAMLIPMVS